MSLNASKAGRLGDLMDECISSLVVNNSALADIAGISPATVSSWRNGHSYGSTKALLHTLLLLDIDPIEFFGLTKIKPLPRK